MFLHCKLTNVVITYFQWYPSYLSFLTFCWWDDLNFMIICHLNPIMHLFGILGQSEIRSALKCTELYLIETLKTLRKKPCRCFKLVFLFSLIHIKCLCCLVVLCWTWCFLTLLLKPATPRNKSGLCWLLLTTSFVTTSLGRFESFISSLLLVCFILCSFILLLQSCNCILYKSIKLTSTYQFCIVVNVLSQTTFIHNTELPL